MSTETTPLDPDEFDIIAFIEGSNYPEKTVKLYTNGKAALQLREARADADSAANKKLIKALEDEIEKSSMTFYLRGLAPAIIEVMMKKIQLNSKDISDEERVKRFLESTDSLTAASIVKVETADGRVDSRSWDTDRAAKLRGALLQSEYEKLADGVNTVNFDSKLFSDSVDAGFSS